MRAPSRSWPLAARVTLSRAKTRPRFGALARHTRPPTRRPACHYPEYRKRFSELRSNVIVVACHGLYCVKCMGLVRNSFLLAIIPVIASKKPCFDRWAPRLKSRNLNAKPCFPLPFVQHRLFDHDGGAAADDSRPLPAVQIHIEVELGVAARCAKRDAGICAGRSVRPDDPRRWSFMPLAVRGKGSI